MSEQPNPAVVPEPPIRTPRTYLVIGTAQATLGHKQGETFTALLDPRQEKALLDGLAIEVVDDDRGAGTQSEHETPDSPGPDAADAADAADPDSPERVPVHKPETPRPKPTSPPTPKEQ